MKRKKENKQVQTEKKNYIGDKTLNQAKIASWPKLEEEWKIEGMEKKSCKIKTTRDFRRT